LNEQLIVQYSKELALNYLKKIGAEIDESHGLYNVIIPTNYEKIFGGIKKRITFEHDVADTHSCELVVPGSNFLSIILSEIRKQAPVIGGHLKKRAASPKEFLDKILTHNCTLDFVNFSEEAKIAIRFYFNINVKSIKSISMLRWVDVDLESLQILDFPSDLEFDAILGKIKYEKGDPRLDLCYTKTIEFLENEIESLARKYIDLTTNNLSRDINSVNQTHIGRIKEINDDLEDLRRKLRDYDRKILSARYVDTQQKYIKQKKEHQERIQEEEQKAIKLIEKLNRDKEAQIEQIEKRYRPVIDFSLIAAQSYSYNSSNCLLDLGNKYSKKQINASFLDPSLSYSLICEICKNNLEQAHLCVNSHLSCDKCIRHCVKCQKDVCIQCQTELNHCYICKEGLCTDCLSKCSFCSDVTCVNHLLNCTHCSQGTCFFCSDSCEFCSNRFCNQSFHSCGSCLKRICIIDSQLCIECTSFFCPNDRTVCAICDKVHCWKDSSKCKLCEQVYNNNCIKNNLCSTCNNLISIKKENPEVQQIILMDSNLKKYNNWESKSNNRYLIFKAKKMLGTKIIVYDKNKNQILVNKKGGWR